MKNEFYFDKLVVGNKKKRYISSIKLREGNLLTPYKADVKGFDFMKATTSEEAKKRFDSIVKNRILESETPDISGILADLKKFEQDIQESVRRGEKNYLPLGAAKDAAAYSNPLGIPGYRGSLIWNYIYPDREISFPSKVSILKLNIFDESDIASMEKEYPVEYRRIIERVYRSPQEKLRSKGLQLIAIPGNEDIPEWCQKYIDMDVIVNSIISQFKGVLDSFGVQVPKVGKAIKSTNRQTNKFSNIVRF